MARFSGQALLVAALAILANSDGVLAADGTRFGSFDAKGLKLHFLVEGKGEPVVLIHGLHSSAEELRKVNVFARPLGRRTRAPTGGRQTIIGIGYVGPFRRNSYFMMQLRLES